MARVIDLSKAQVEPIEAPEAEPVEPSLPLEAASKPDQSKPVEVQPGFIRKWGTLLVLSLALAIIIIDTTLLNVSLRSIIADLHTDIKGLQWVITSYALVLAALTITGGRLGDLFGRKRMFVAGAVIFAAGSLLASFSHRLGVLVAGESIIEGIGAALMLPATASLLISTFRGPERAIAFGVWGSVAGAASAVGPILGGYLTSHYSWRWGFRINVAVAAVLVLGSLAIREVRDRHQKPQLDVVGIILSALGLLAVVFGIIQSSTYGWFEAKQPYALFGFSLGKILSVTVFSLIMGSSLLGLFVWWERRHELRGHTPLVSMGLFKNRQFTSGALTMALTTLGMVGIIFIMPVFFQAVEGLDALHTGYALLPMSLSLLVVGPLSGFLNRWITPKRLIQVGLVIISLGIVVLQSLLKVGATAGSLAPGLALYGIGMGFIMAQVSNLTLSAVSLSQAGEAAGVNNTLRQVGSSLGSAILGAVLLTAITQNVTHGIYASRVIPTAKKPALAATVGAHASGAAFEGPTTAATHTSTTIAAEVKRITAAGLTSATRTTVLYSLPFPLLALLMSTRLMGKNEVATEELATAPH